MGRALAFAALAVLTLSLASPSLAAGTPAVEVEIGGSAYVRTVTVRVAGAKKRALANVSVTASMTAPGHLMTVGPRRAVHAGRGVYRTQLRFPMLGRWTLVVRVDGPGLRPATARLSIGL